ncbi:MULTISPECIES: hypothetical protein [Bacteroidales]|uniref:DUF1735 domain-containing protein n=1 Tax=Coprobacter secundus subsp. similis TaxID=2751153 RepID=A0A7G1HRW4_9BACT|nr:MULTISPECIES: hypothetical protein [Bacteroidales]BCI61703.1 hypothetical protein Cop2CBH44_00560 [Coprobacter secundus subsp. similis]CCY38812.1 putative uncharacterized protein [Tannerella sp. CAG:118]
MKKRTVFLGLAVFLLGLATGCSKDIDDYPKSNLRAISYFSFKPYHNADKNVFVEHVGEIDEVNKVIRVVLPPDVVLTGLRPYIELSPWTTVTPGSLTPMDFTSESVDFEVRAESGKVAVYSVVRELTYVYTKAELYSVSFPDFRDETGEVLRRVFPNFSNNSAVTVTVPEGTALERILVELELSAASQKASVEVCDDGSETEFVPFSGSGYVDFTHTVIFRVTPESGSAVNYRVTLAYPEEGEGL